MHRYLTGICLISASLLCENCKLRSSEAEKFGDLAGASKKGISTSLEERLTAQGATVSKLRLDSGPGSNLIQEMKIKDLISPATPVKYEASGITLLDGFLYVVIDNQYRALIKIPVTQSETSAALGAGGELVGANDFNQESKAGFEGVTLVRNGAVDLMYLLQEVKWKDIAFKDPGKADSKLKDPSKAEVSLNGSAVSRFFPASGEIEHQGFANQLIPDEIFETENKGYEGIANLSVAGSTYILTLCEGNFCHSKDTDLQEFGGIITVFAENKKKWKPITKISLGNKVPFLDFSDMDIHWDKVDSTKDRHQAYGKILITSQSDSAIWSADVIMDISDGDASLKFSNEKFLLIGADLGYCNIEGITWLNVEAGLVAIASDAAKKDEFNAKCQDKDQSIHILRLGSQGT